MAAISLQGRTAVVTGGCSGIGRAVAVRLAQSGARVLVGDLTGQPDEFLAGWGISIRKCDVRRELEIRALIDEAAAWNGRVDILVNNAGIGMVKQIGEVSEEDWDNCLDTNLKAAFFGSKHTIARMQADGAGGCIVNIASNAGLLPRAHDPVYSISKMSLVALTKSLALCHARDRIRINAICPGPVADTRMIDSEIALAADPVAARQKLINASPLARAFERMIRPDEIADAVLYLVSDGAMMVTGTSLAIDGGKSLGVPPLQ